MTENLIIGLIKKDIEELLGAKRNFKREDEKLDYSSELDDSIIEDFKKDLEQLSLYSRIEIHHVPVRSSRPVAGNLVTFIKRAIRKSTFWLYQPLFNKITNFNSILISILNRVVLRMDKSKRENMQLYQDLRDEIERRFPKELSSFQELDSNIRNELSSFQELDLSIRKELSSFQELDLSIRNERKEIQNEINNLKKIVEDYRGESSFLRAKLALVLQYINTGKIIMDNDGKSCDKEFNNLAKGISGIDSIYYLFEQQFRGTEEMIKHRQSAYVSDIKKVFDKCGGYVLDIGSGRGEFLQLCYETGVKAKGIDINDMMVERCREKGLDVVKADVLSYLTSLPNESLCAFTAFQVAEHLTPEQLWQLVQLALVKLKPGGLILLETVNPDSLDTFKNFYVDLTHQRPIPSITLRFIVEAAGFKNAEVRFSSPVSEEVKLQGSDINVQKLNNLLFGYRDYAIMGWR